MPFKLLLYIAIGAIIGLFFGGLWQGVSAMVLIYIAQRIEYFLGRFEYFLHNYENKNFKQ